MTPLNVMNWSSPWVAMVIFVTGLSLGGSGAWLLGRAPLQVELAQQATSHAFEKTQLAQHAAKTLQDAQARGDALSVGLLSQQKQIDQLKTEKRDAIRQATTGKPCLNGPALRLLSSAPGLSVRDLPPTTGSVIAAGEPIATDTDIAFWMVDAGAQFEACRARLDALIDWHTPTKNLVTP